eukprot:COSAG01_NODE_26510_length_711_cov_173.106209_2_plen_95_part_01
MEDARLLAEEAGIPWSGLGFEELREQLRAHYSQKNHTLNPEEAEPPDQHPTGQHCTPHEKTIQKKVEDEPERRLQPGPEPEPEPEPETRQQTRRK